MAQIFGTHSGVFLGREYLKEVIMAIQRSPINIHVRVFWHLDAHNFRLACQWLYNGFYWMLVITSGGLLLTGTRPVQRLGGFQIVSQMMELISVELTRACGLGCLDCRGCPYHFDLRYYVSLALRAVQVCRR